MAHLLYYNLLQKLPAVQPVKKCEEKRVEKRKKNAKRTKLIWLTLSTTSSAGAPLLSLKI
jgi:hypothetical protein